MDARDLARIAHYRRWLQPDWRRWLHPDWERFVHPAQRAAMRKDFALRDRAFETELARRWREEQEAREREEQERLEAEHQAEIEREALKIKAELAALRFELTMRRKAWEAECAERKRRADIAWERFKAAFMRGDFAPRQKANFNPNQQRVAAGNPDGGQWTSGGGPEHGNDEPQLVQDSADRLLNNHIIRNHVAKTDEELKGRIRAEQFPGLFKTFGRDRNGSFDSIEAARDFISQTLVNNPGEVARVANGELNDSFLTWRFGYHTGREAIMDPPGPEIRMRPTYEVGVLIAHDPRSDFGYRVVTAFPRNFNPRTGR